MPFTTALQQTLHTLVSRRSSSKKVNEHQINLFPFYLVPGIAFRHENTAQNQPKLQVVRPQKMG